MVVDIYDYVWEWRYLCWYSYVTPLMTHVAGFSENSMTFIMVLAGLSMTVGNLMGGKFSDQYGAARVVKYTQVIMLPVCLPFSLRLLFLGWQ